MQPAERTEASYFACTKTTRNASPSQPHAVWICALPVLVDEMDNAIDEAYGAAPERLYPVRRGGARRYRAQAPQFFDLDE